MKTLLSRTLLCLATLITVELSATEPVLTAIPPWEIGPFVKLPKPILSPTPDSTFHCPVRNKEVRWEKQNVYNPAAVVRDGKVYLVYRADDKSPNLKWGRTCRIGMAHSEDGILLMTQGGHHSLGTWVLRQALIDRNDLKTVLKEQSEPFLYPEYDWEKTGFVGNTTVANGLIPFKDRWLLYYGAADHVIGLAIGTNNVGR